MAEEVLLVSPQTCARQRTQNLILKDFQNRISVNLSHPTANLTPPSHDAAFQPTVRLDVRPLEDGAPLDADPVLDHDVRSDGDVGTHAAVSANLGRWILKQMYEL